MQDKQIKRFLLSTFYIQSFILRSLNVEKLNIFEEDEIPLVQKNIEMLDRIISELEEIPNAKA